MTKFGQRTDPAGRVWQRYRCRPAVGAGHHFQMLVSGEAGDVVVIATPPACPTHGTDSVKVVRRGTSGRVVKRQRYACFYLDAEGVERSHKFTEPLPREYIGTRRVECPHCEEVVGVHRGDQGSSRRSSWPLLAVVQCLHDLARGVSYGEASVELRNKRDAALAHLATHAEAEPEPDDEPDGDAAAVAVLRMRSAKSVERRNAWHTAGSLIEHYAPLLWGQVNDRLTAEATAQRERNDAQLAAGKPVTDPMVFVLDDVPVHVRIGRSEKVVTWSVLVVGVVTRVKGKPDQRNYRMRLARALPGAATATGWFMVLHELGVVPDVVVADGSAAIESAVAQLYRGRAVTSVPSLWHFTRSLEKKAAKTAGLHLDRVEGQAALLIAPLAEHLGLLSRDELVAGGTAGWARWWDGLEAIAAEVGDDETDKGRALRAGALTAVRAMRREHEAGIAAALPVWKAQPFVPASNSGVENHIRDLLKPILRGRAESFGNLARTNGLLNLVVCRDHGLFANHRKVANLIRADNLADGAGGWAVPLRSWDDPQPPAPDDDPEEAEVEAALAAAAHPADYPPDDARDADHAKPAKRAAKGKRKGRPRGYSSLRDIGLVPQLLDARLEEAGGLLP